MSRRPLRGAELGGAPVAIPLRDLAELAPPRPPRTPEAAMAAAVAEAEELVARAQAERERVLAEGYQQGFAAGHEEGRAELAAALAAVRRAADALEAERVRVAGEATLFACELSVEVAARVLRAEVCARPERVLDVVRGAIRRASERERLLVRVNPEDLGRCRETAPDLLAELGGISRLDVVDDPRVETGSCVLETPGGDVDATLSSQLARIREALVTPPDDALVEP